MTFFDAPEAMLALGSCVLFRRSAAETLGQERVRETGVLPNRSVKLHAGGHSLYVRHRLGLACK